MKPSDKTTAGHDGPPLGRPGAAPPPATVTPDATQFGRFAVVRKLGAGGMGVVYEAIDTDGGGRVALKTLRSINPRSAQRFKQEFRALAGLSHDNVVQLRELHGDGAQLFFTMELVHGTELLQWVGAPGVPSAWSHDDRDLPPSPDLRRLSDAMRGLVHGIDAVHQHGKLHRDLKPSNVLVTEAGRVVVLDFGLVRDTDGGPGDGLTVSGMVMGTPAYMSPEQAAGGELGPPSDWYALGVILFQCLTGQLPHAHAAGDVGVLAAKATDPAPDPRGLAPHTPPALAQLCLALLSPDPALRPTAAQILDWLPSGRSVSAPARPRVDPPLLGRDAALGVLHEAYNAASLGRTVVAFIEGPSGIGKSALVDHFVRSVLRRGTESVAVLRGRCYEAESVPYKALDPLVDNLSRHLRRLPPAAVAALLPRQVHALTRLFPALLDVPAIDQAPRNVPAEPQELRARAFAALQEMLARISDRRPLVATLDDLQWMDEDSAALLLEVLRPPNAPNLLLIASFRQEDAAAETNPGLARLVDALGKLRPKLDLRRITVGPLPAAHAAMLARVLLREQGLPLRMADRIAKESEGSPLFASELVRHLAATAAATGGPAEGLASPTLAQVLAERIAGLPAPARAVLHAVALSGRRVPVTIALEAASATSSASDPVAQLRAEHFVRTVGGADNRQIETFHDRIRAAAVESMEPPLRVATHRALATALRGVADPDPEHLLHHYRAAGDDDNAAEYAVRAADRATEQLAFDRAAALLSTALQLGARDRATLLRRQGEALANAGAGAEAAKAFLAAAALEDGALRVELQRRAAMHLLLAGYSEQGRAELAHVLQAHGLTKPASRSGVVAALLVRRAKLKLRGLRWTESARPDPTALARVDACWSASRGLAITDILEGGYFQAEHVLQALACGEPERVATALAEEAKVASYFGDRGLTRARALLDRVDALAKQIDTPKARALALAARALVLLMSAQWKASLQANRKAEALLRDHCTGVQEEIFDTLAGQAAALWATGDMPELESLCRRTAHEAAQRSNIYHATMADLFIAVPVDLTHDDVVSAERGLAATIASSREHGIQVAEIQIINARCACGIYSGKPGAAWDALASNFDAMRSNPLMRASFPRAEVEGWRGRLALAAAEQVHDPAERRALANHASKAAKNLLGQSFPSAPPMGRLLRAGLAHLRGDRSAAEADLRAAGDAFAELDMDVWAAAARRRLGMLIRGDSGFILRQRAEATMTSVGAKDMPAFTRLWAPGFADADPPATAT